METIDSDIQVKAYESIKNSTVVDAADVLSKIRVFYENVDDDLIVKNVEIALSAHAAASRWPFYNTNSAPEATRLTESYLSTEIPNASERLKFAVLNRIMRSWLY